jgi:hypothetical protein
MGIVMVTGIVMITGIAIVMSTTIMTMIMEAMGTVTNILTK